MIVLYRLTDIPSSNPSPIYQENKQRLNKMCLRSFVEAFKDIQPRMYFFCDYVEDEELTRYMIDSIVPWKHSIEFTKRGINKTMLLSYELAKNYDDYVLFQECDYLYRPGIGRTFHDALNNFQFVSPYDHKNFYIDESIHSKNIKIELVSNHHFRTTERNTMTWGTHGNIVLENYDLFMQHGYLDSQLWYDLKDKGYQMWVPIPSMATHMVEDWLAPGVNWQSIWREL